MEYKQFNILLRFVRLLLFGVLIVACASPGTQPFVAAPALPAPANASESASGEWAMEGHAPDRSRATSDVLALPTRLVSEYEIGGDTQFGSPVGVAQGTLFADGEQLLYALNAADGTERWRFNLPGSFLSPAVAGSRVFVRAEAGADGFIFALSLDAGAKLWQYRFPAVGSSYDNVGGHVTSPLVAENRVLVGAAQSLYALDVETGAVVWEYGLQNPIASSVAVADGLVYVSDFTHLYALSVADGSEKWSFEFDTVSLFFAPVVLADQVIITSFDTAYSLDRRTGQLLWAKQLPDLQIIPAGAYGDQIYVKSTNSLVALDRTSGAELWRYTTLNFISLPAVTEGYLYVIDRYGEGSHLLAIGRTDGQEVWRSEQAQLARSAPTVAAGRLFVRTENGRILGYQ
ncbi:MAG: PQQ-binding-like beta-propeller repeat protein [Chloroflexi bacterium]|nr:PQQ-binding-like beta-propeller repeat protein [Chloroflexota bacterium]